MSEKNRYGINPTPWGYTDVVDRQPPYTVQATFRGESRHEDAVAHAARLSERARERDRARAACHACHAAPTVGDR